MRAEIQKLRARPRIGPPEAVGPQEPHQRAVAGHRDAGPAQRLLRGRHGVALDLDQGQWSGVMMGVMELVSPNTRDLNSINASKLNDILPYLVDSIRRTIERKENEIELLIQQECTSIHPSVHWKFRK